MPMRRVAVVTLLFIGAGCGLDLSVPADVEVLCSDNRQCPSGSICDTNVGRCVATETPSLRIDVPDELVTRYTREVPFDVQIVSSDASTRFDLQLEFRATGDAEVTWRPMTLALSSAEVSDITGSPSGTTYAVVWDALADATAANGLTLARVDLDADGRVADPIVRAANVIVRAVARSRSGAARSVPAESPPFSVGNEPPIATIDAAIGESGVINVVVGLRDSSGDACGFELQFRGPDGFWRNAALAYGNTDALGCRADVPLAASVGWRSDAPMLAPDVQTPQGIGAASFPNVDDSTRVILRARAYDTAEASAPEQHWGVWSPPVVLTRVTNQTPPVVLSASASRAAVTGGTAPTHIRYTIADDQSDVVDVTFEYSQDAGTHWYRCVEYPYAASEGTTGLVTGARSSSGGGGVEHLFTWDASSLVTRPTPSTLVRLTIDDSRSLPTTFVFALGQSASPSGIAPHDAFAHTLFSSALLRSNGTQSGRAIDVAIADFDNDGDKDLVFPKPEVTSGNAFSIFRNDGSGGAWPQTYLGGAASHAVAGNFLNNTTRQSMVSVDAAGVATVWAGNGNLTFSADTSFSVGTIIDRFVARDLDRDGDDDLVAYRDEFSNHVLSVYRNTGVAGGRFSSTPTFSVAYDSPLSFVVEDIDGDGHLDIAVALQSRLGHILAGDGTLGFTEVATFACENGNNNEQSLGAGDMTGDGIVDLVSLGNRYLVYQIGTGGPGAFTFREQEVLITASMQSGAFADLNGDGLMDWVGSASGSEPIAIVLSGYDDAAPELQRLQPRLATVPLEQYGVFADDLDGDGIAEIIALTGNSFGSAAVLRADGPSTVGGQMFRAGATLDVQWSGFPVVASFDADGIPDVAFVSNVIRLHRGLGAAGVANGAFRDQPEQSIIFTREFGELPVSPEIADAKAVDVNGDGILDIMMLVVLTANDPFTREAYLGWALGRPLQGVADGRFERLQLMPVSPFGAFQGGSLAIADFDADGLPDAAYLYQPDWGSSAFELGVAFNRGAALFTTQDASYALGNTVSFIDVGYVGADVFPDLLVTVPSADQFRIFQITASPVNRAGPFAISNITGASTASEAHFADLDWDGVTDVWMKYGTFLEMRAGNAGGGFSAVPSFLPGVAMAQVELFDATLDGVNDLVLLGYPNAFVGGVGAGVAPGGVPSFGFATPTTFAGEDLGSGVGAVVNDANCDGVLDVTHAARGALMQTLAGTRDLFTPQLSVSPYASHTLSAIGMGPLPMHPWHVAPAAPCAARGRWEDDLRAFRARQGTSPRFRVLAPARWLGETTRYVKTRVGEALRVMRTPRFTPPPDLATADVPRGLVASLSVARGRRASVIPTRLRVYRQSEALRSAADYPADALHGSPDAGRLLPQLPTSTGLIDVIERRWTWESIPLDGDGDLATGTGKRFVYDPASGRADILTDEGGLYVLVEEL